MPETRLSVLNHTGDITITWDHADEAAKEQARAEVERLRKAGYSFFLVDGSPADAITAGQGTLVVKRISADELIDPPADDADINAEPDPESSEPNPPADPPKRRGRPPKAARQAVAVRPLAGG